MENEIFSFCQQITLSWCIFIKDKREKKKHHSFSHFIYVVVFVEFPFFLFSLSLYKRIDKNVRKSCSIFSSFFFFHFYSWQTQKWKKETKVVRAWNFRPLFHFPKQPFYYFASKFSGLFHGFQTLIGLDGYIYSFILFSFIMSAFFLSHFWCLWGLESVGSDYGEN